MLRYDYEYSNEMINAEWKEHLGLRTMKPTSFFIRHRLMMRNPFLMLFFQLVILTIIIFILGFIRLIPILEKSPNTSAYEGITISSIALAEFLFILWLMCQVKQVDDAFYIKDESYRLFIVFAITFCVVYVLHILKWNFVIEYIWFRTFISILFITCVGCFCYFETMWVLKRFDRDWKKWEQKQNVKPDVYSQYTLSNILQVQKGFEAVMRFLLKEFSCENLLCYVEATLFLIEWCRYAIYTIAMYRNISEMLYIVMKNVYY